MWHVLRFSPLIYCLSLNCQSPRLNTSVIHRSTFNVFKVQACEVKSQSGGLWKEGTWSRTDAFYKGLVIKYREMGGGGGGATKREGEGGK